METLTIFTKALLEKGVDLEVTMRQTGVNVRLIDLLTNDTITEGKGISLEEALAIAVANSASGYGIIRRTY